MLIIINFTVHKVYWIPVFRIYYQKGISYKGIGFKFLKMQISIYNRIWAELITTGINNVFHQMMEENHKN